MLKVNVKDSEVKQEKHWNVPEKKKKNSIVLIFAIKNTPPHVIFGNSTDAMTQKY